MAVKGAIIAIDFDGTVVTHAYPHMGMDAGAVPVLKELVAADNYSKKPSNGSRNRKFRCTPSMRIPDRSPGLRRRKSTPTFISTTVHWDVRSALWTA